jgi:catechol 2,3-dioxygenase-like lactoylglutathione lyase family enzyme
MSNTFHVALYVEDLDAAVVEYQKILGIAPTKVRPGYAKFEVADPPVILSLNVGGEPGTLSHLGIRYPGTGEVASELARAKREGLDHIQQDGVTCCYAKADKFWVVDSDKVPWEMYAACRRRSGNGRRSEASRVLEPKGCSCLWLDDGRHRLLRGEVTGASPSRVSILRVIPHPSMDSRIEGGHRNVSWVSYRGGSGEDSRRREGKIRACGAQS